jgi:hypothetical protein
MAVRGEWPPPSWTLAQELIEAAVRCGLRGVASINCVAMRAVQGIHCLLSGEQSAENEGTTDV